MRIEIAESLTTGKHSPATCEDGIVATEHHVAVVDGSTSKSAVQMEEGMKNGRLAMLLISEAIASLPPDIDLKGFCQHGAFAQPSRGTPNRQPRHL